MLNTRQLDKILPLVQDKCSCKSMYEIKMCEEAELLHANHNYATVQFRNGRKSTD